MEVLLLVVSLGTKEQKALIEKKDYEETELNINPDFYIKAKDDLYADIEKKS